NSNRWLLTSVLLCLVFVGVTPTAADQAYTIIDIGPLGGDATSIATGINNSGDVIGISTDRKGRSTAFFWRDGKIKKLDDPDKKHTFVTGINDLDQVVGFSIPERGPLRAFLHRLDNGERFELPTLPDTVSLTSGINNSGQVVGRFHSTEAHDHEKGERAF